MARDLLSLCREYLGSSSPAIRAKAVAALAADGREDGAAEIADVLLAEHDDATRKLALNAILKLDETARNVAVARLGQALGDPERRVVAHDSLTWLRDRGVTVPGGPRSRRESLRLAFAVRRAGRRASAAAMYPWSLGFALNGAVMTLFLVTIKAAAEGVSWTLLATVSVAVLVAAPWLARVVAADARRGDGYLDRRSGWTIELLAAGLDSLPAFALLGALMLALWPSLAEVGPATVFLLGAGFLAFGFVFTASIRLATLSCSVLARRSWVHTLLGGGAGWGAGVTAATVGFLLPRWGLGPESEIIALAAGLWLFSLATAAGVGGAFARLERLESDAVTPRLTRREVRLGLPSMLAGALLVALWAWFFWHRLPVEPITAPAQEKRVARGQCDRVPTWQRIRVEQGVQRLETRLSRRSNRLALRLKDQDVVLKPAKPDLYQYQLPPGDYLLEVIDPEAPGPSLPERLFDLAERLAWQGKKKRAWTEQQEGEPLGLCTAPRFYPLGARSVESFDLEIELDASAGSASVEE